MQSHQRIPNNLHEKDEVEHLLENWLILQGNIEHSPDVWIPTTFV